MVRSRSESVSFSSHESYRDFFQTLSVGDIYSKRRESYKKIEITRDQFERWVMSDKEFQEERWDFAESHGLREIAAIGYSGGVYFIEESPFEKLANWVPHCLERELILRFVGALTDSEIRPAILDVGCCSGLTTHLLAIDGQAYAIGLDVEINRATDPELPSYAKCASLVESDLWDIIDQYGPVHSSAQSNERKKLFGLVKNRYEEDGQVFHKFGDYPVQFGDPYILNTEIARLQDVAPQGDSSSTLELVICSFMDRNIDLTIPIRDGLFPKAIVYVRPTNGLSGAGDYYRGEQSTTFHSEDGDYFDDEEDVGFNKNSAISFNPGINYRTVARWLTISDQDWNVFRGEFYGGFSAEVVVQVRNDVVLNSEKPIKVSNFNFDKEIKKQLSQRGDWTVFVDGLARAKSDLFGLE